MVKKHLFSKKTAAKSVAVLLSAAFVLSACGGGDKKKTTSQSEQQQEEESTEKEIQVEGTEVPVNLATNLNIIEDNNRNYYEVFVASFYDSDGDGMGDIKGLIEKLDYINDGDDSTDTDLGCNGIWLMPISPSPSYHKYDVVDYYGIDEAYGTLDDFKLLIEECHKRDIKLIIDLVMNHSSVANQWFKDAKDYLKTLPDDKEPDASECKYVNYYTFSKTEVSGQYYPAGSSSYYYEGMFSQQMPDLNLDNPDVRAEFEQIAKYWLDMGVDGFRLDAAKEYFSGETDKNIEVLTWFNNYVKSVNPDAYIVAETWCADNARYTESGINSAFDFSYADSTGTAYLVTRANDETYNGRYFADSIKKSQDTLAASNPDAIMAAFIDNHDINRKAHMLAFEEKHIKFAHGLLGLTNGSPFIYYGDEIGLGGVGADENKRSPMIWSSTDTTGICKGPINMKSEEVINKFESVEDQLKDDKSILSYVKQSIKLRNTFPEIARGKIEVIDEVTDPDICAISKTYNDSKIIILANANSEEPKVVELSRENNGYTCIQGILTVGKSQPKQVDDKIVLPPLSIVILK